MPKKQFYFGEHFTLDGYGGNPVFLDDRKIVLKCLSELPGLLGMRKLASPKIYRADGNDKKDPGGWSGFVVIEESHISIHTFPGRKFVSIDVYTCRNGLDTKFVTSYFHEKFSLKDAETNFIKRGMRYPKNNI